MVWAALLAMVWTLFTGLAACGTDNGSDGGGQECTDDICDDPNRGLRDQGTRPTSDAGNGESDAVSADEPDGGGVSLTDTDTGGGGGDPDGTVEPPAECGPGRIDGRVCAPSGDSWVGGADVVVTGIDCDGLPFTVETTSDSDGYFSFAGVPAGEHELRITKGSFEAVHSVLVRAGETTDLVSSEEKACLVDEDIRIAVINGIYDDIQSILDRLGVEYDLFNDFNLWEVSEAETFLTNPTAMAEYDIIMINCGEQYWNFGWLEWDPTAVHAQIGHNLRGFVEGGGSLYVSDWAFFLVEAAYPSAIQFSPDESNYENALRGDMGEFPAVVVDAALEAAIGRRDVTINFPEQAWVVAERLDSSVTTLVEAPRVTFLEGGSMTDAPLLVSFQPAGAAGGTIFYTSFHNHAQLEDDIEAILHHVIFSL